MTSSGRGDDTAISTTKPSSTGDAVSPPPALPGYEVATILGQGGMGEVWSAEDLVIGRQVAIKRLLGTEQTNDAMERFLREAKIQARLDHPAIVPVYQLGTDGTGRPYFVMKQLAGTTLHELLRTHQATLQRMLRALVDVCLAIDLAHARGVVHRDLKPANIVLGDYGEVYVLDWGVARVLAERDTPPSEGSPSSSGGTERGAMLGTPGYMAPEQMRGEDDVGPAADVYSLGAILFEILAGEPLHPRGTAAVPSTLAGGDHAPSRRTPDRAIPPELDEACASALGADPGRRPTARALAVGVQHYLDGDRDVERRRVMAADHLARARSVAGDPHRHAEALQIAGRALALDPESADAAAVVTSLMLAPPHDVAAPELEARLRAIDLAYSRRSATLATYSLLAFFAFIPIVVWSGFTAPIFGLCGWLGMAALLWFIRQFGGVGGRPLIVTCVGFALIAAFISRVLGPFLITPAITGLIAMGLLSQPDLMRRPAFVLGLLLATFLVPVALEAIGVLAPTWSVANESVISRSAIMHIGGAPTKIILIVGNVAYILIMGLLSRGMSASRREAQRSVEVHAWRLQQLVPVPTPEMRAAR